jgi:hypothetical protein
MRLVHEISIPQNLEYTLRFTVVGVDFEDGLYPSIAKFSFMDV